MGPLKIGEMRPGEWRLLTAKEVAMLKAAAPTAGPKSA
jgi:16S rRNA U516 pseudouridylate synthase RsuA-like enzyme